MRLLIVAVGSALLLTACEWAAIPDALAEKTQGLKAGDPGEPDTIIGPLISEDAVRLVRERVDEAVAKGAKVLAGGDGEGSVYRATLLADVPADSDFAQRETFGPVAAIEVVDGPRPYLRTKADNVWNDNLLALPQCPG